MHDNFIKAILTGNVFLFLSALEGFLRAGTAFFAFSAAGVSLVLLIAKEKHNIKKIIGGDPDEKPPV